MPRDIFLQYYAAVISYPINVGGRRLNSWPAFIPITFELTVLFAAISAVLGMLIMNGLPTPYHPVFNVPRFALASRNQFFPLYQGAGPQIRYPNDDGFLGGFESTRGKCQLKSNGHTRAFRIASLAAWPMRALPLTGCRLDMQVQPRYNPYDPRRFFRRWPFRTAAVAGTVARSEPLRARPVGAHRNA